MQYNRHYDNGFTRVFTNDLYNIEERMQTEVDPYLYLLWNPHTGEHLIMDDITNTAVMSIPQLGFEELSGRIIPHLHRIKLGEGYSPTKEIEKSEHSKQSNAQKELDDVSEYLAKEVAKTL